jgi:hypothetical protein
MAIPAPIVTLVPTVQWVTLEQGDTYVDRGVINITATGTSQLPAPTFTFTSVYVNAAGIVTLKMSLAAQMTAGQQWEIIDTSGLAASNNILINGNGSLINGAATRTINTNFGSVILEWTGSAFSVVT